MRAVDGMGWCESRGGWVEALCFVVVLGRVLAGVRIKQSAFRAAGQAAGQGECSLVCVPGRGSGSGSGWHWPVSVSGRGSVSKSCGRDKIARLAVVLQVGSRVARLARCIILADGWRKGHCACG